MRWGIAIIFVGFCLAAKAQGPVEVVLPEKRMAPPTVQSDLSQPLNLPMHPTFLWEADREANKLSNEWHSAWIWHPEREPIMSTEVTSCGTSAVLMRRLMYLEYLLLSRVIVLSCPGFLCSFIRCPIDMVIKW